MGKEIQMRKELLAVSHQQLVHHERGAQSTKRRAQRGGAACGGILKWLRRAWQRKLSAGSLQLSVSFADSSPPKRGEPWFALFLLNTLIDLGTPPPAVIPTGGTSATCDERKENERKLCAFGQSEEYPLRVPFESHRNGAQLHKKESPSASLSRLQTPVSRPGIPHPRTHNLP